MTRAGSECAGARPRMEIRMRTIRLLPPLVPVLWMVGFPCAAFGAGEAEAPEGEVVLEAGEIDVRTVQAGARVVVVHGRGERHPVSGEWARLDTSMGYVQAVGAETLVLAREGDLRQVRISLDRIRRLAMVGPPSREAAINRPAASSKSRPRREHLPVRMAGREDEGARVFRKLGMGVLGGVFGAYAGFGVGGILGSGQCSGSEEPFCLPESAVLVGMAGLAFGTAAGVSLSDPRSRYEPALGGSVAALVGICGGMVGYHALGGDMDPLDSWELYAAAVFGTPVVFATLASEWFRGPPEDSRLSLRLSPTPGRGFSATAALRF